MASKRNLLAVILGGGAGKRLFPLTRDRSKPAVPLGGKYRLVDVPISNCINSDVIRMFVLTQYNSASLNKHVATTYRFSNFADGFVEILAAEQTPESSADITIAVIPIVPDSASEFGLLKTDSEGRVIEFREKPEGEALEAMRVDTTL